MSKLVVVNKVFCVDGKITYLIYKQQDATHENKYENKNDLFSYFAVIA
jgi:hypothetical protein